MRGVIPAPWSLGSTRRLAALALLVAACSLHALIDGCSPPSYGTLIPGSQENDELLRGKVAPTNAIDRFVVYLYPPDLYKAEHYEDLARCAMVEFSGDAPAHELRMALQAPRSKNAKGMGPERRGTIMVVLRNGTRLYLHYTMRATEVRLEAPPHGGNEPRAVYNSEIEDWLWKYTITIPLSRTSP